jgi:hypothetical protein
MSNLLKNILRFILLMFVQIFVLNRIPALHHLINPYIYFLFILWLPFKTGRASVMILGFITGIVLDYFTKTPGLHASACVLIGYLRPFLINLLIPQEGAEINYEEPSIKSLSFAPYFIYILLLTFIHHAWLFLLEAIQFAGVMYFLSKTFLSVAVSLVLIMVIELLFVRRQRIRANA